MFFHALSLGPASVLSERPEPEAVESFTPEDNTLQQYEDDEEYSPRSSKNIFRVLFFY